MKKHLKEYINFNKFDYEEDENIIKIMTKEQILNLYPSFKFGGMTITDWFEITEGNVFFCIRSGLKHADGKTKSPYYYKDCVVGKNSKKIALYNFSKWWTFLNVNK